MGPEKYYTAGLAMSSNVAASPDRFGHESCHAAPQSSHVAPSPEILPRVLTNAAPRPDVGPSSDFIRPNGPIAPNGPDGHWAHWAQWVQCAQWIQWVHWTRGPTLTNVTASADECGPISANVDTITNLMFFMNSMTIQNFRVFQLSAKIHTVLNS